MKHLNDINWNHLYYFYEVARLRSIKLVSESLGQSPSTISEQIKKLESKIGTKLFNRTKGGLLLTRGGEELFEHARLIFAEGYRLLERFSSDDIGGYPVTVGVDQAIFDPLSAEFISQYWDEYAKYGVVNSVHQGDHDIIIQNIVQENIDWGLSLTPSKRKSLTSHAIGTHKLSFCCAQFIYDRFKSKKDILYYMPYIEYAHNHPFKNKVSAFFRSLGVTVNEFCYTDNYNYMMTLLEKGRGFTLLPEKLVKSQKHLKSFHLDSYMEQPIYAIWKNSSEELISISVLKNLAIAHLSRQKQSKFLQLQVSDIPKDKLKKQK